VVANWIRFAPLNPSEDRKAAILPMRSFLAWKASVGTPAVAVEFPDESPCSTNQGVDMGGLVSDVT